MKGTLGPSAPSIIPNPCASIFFTIPVILSVLPVQPCSRSASRFAGIPRLPSGVRAVDDREVGTERNGLFGRQRVCALVMNQTDQRYCFRDTGLYGQMFARKYFWYPSLL